MYRKAKQYFLIFFVVRAQKSETFFIFLNLLCVYKKTKQQKTTPLYLLSEGNTLPVILAVHLHLHLQQ